MPWCAAMVAIDTLVVVLAQPPLRLATASTRAVCRGVFNGSAVASVSLETMWLMWRFIGHQMATGKALTQPNGQAPGIRGRIPRMSARSARTQEGLHPPDTACGWLSADQVGRRLGKTRATVIEMAQRGEIGHYRIEGARQRWRFTLEHVEAYEARQREWLAPEAAAELLGVARFTVVRFCRESQLSHVVDGRVYRLRRETVEDLGRLNSLEAAAKKLSVSRSTVRRLLEAGTLSAFSAGTRRYISDRAIASYLASTEHAPRARD